MPAYLDMPAKTLGEGSGVKVRVLGDMASMAQDFANVMFEQMKRKPTATFIVPVGPVDQYPILAERINRGRLDCREICLINMDEYLTDEDDWIAAAHPLSFRGFMDRLFYDRLDPKLAPRKENRIFPHPDRCEAIQKIIDARGGVDVCFGGIGINGHIAFNEPPDHGVSGGEMMSDENFLNLSTRVLGLTRETRTINSVTVGGEISIIPWRAVTVGMKECLGAKKLRFYCNRPWQSAVVRRALHGPITAACPASFLRTHIDAEIAIADYVAAEPEIKLR